MKILFLHSLKHNHMTTQKHLTSDCGKFYDYLLKKYFYALHVWEKNQKGWGFKPNFPSFLHDLKKGNMEQGLQTSDPWS